MSDLSARILRENYPGLFSGDVATVLASLIEMAEEDEISGHPFYKDGWPVITVHTTSQVTAWLHTVAEGLGEKLPVPPDPLEFEPPEYDTLWVDLDGTSWDLTELYADREGRLWRWAGGYELNDKVNRMEPLFSRARSIPDYRDWRISRLILELGPIRPLIRPLTP